MAKSTNITIPISPGTASVSVIGGSGTGGVLSNGTYSWTQPYSTNAQYTGITQIQSALKVSGGAEFTGAVKIQGVDIGETLAKINQRLAILVPDPKLMDKYAALKEAYDHYKTLEALCVDSNENRTEE